jgi:DNA-directed RNA polymerase specialized sigma24 family protein
MPHLHQQIQGLTADRQSPEARALYGTIARYVERRVFNVVRYSASDLFSSNECEEVVGDVMLQLMTGALVQFRGSTIGELMAYIRTVTDRRIWRLTRRRVREKHFMQSMEARDELNTESPRPDSFVREVPDVALSDKDEAYLRDLLRAGSKAEYARRMSLSRAAVTQRVQRILRRISALQPQQRMAVDAWLQHAARQAIEEDISLRLAN